MGRVNGGGGEVEIDLPRIHLTAVNVLAYRPAV
jgi:hypothetical protein